MKRKAPLVLVSSAAITAGVVLSSVSYANSLTTAKSKAATVKEQKQQTQAKINRLSSRESSLTNQVHSLQSQISTLKHKISTNKAEINKRSKEITNLESDIKSTEKKLQEQNQLLEQRLRVMYEDGHVSYLEVLFSSTSFSDMLNRFQLLSSVAQEDHKLLQSIQATKNRLDQKNKDLQSQQAAQKRIYQTLLSQQKQQQRKQAQEQKLLKQVHSAKLSAQAALHQENAALSSLASQIRRLEIEYAYHGQATGWTWPVPQVHAISSGYGWRMLWGHKDFHPGIDIPGYSGGEAIVAATSGRVLYAGAATGYGHWIVVQSAGGLVEVYGHIVGLRVHPGEVVHTGERIATIGSGIQGWSTGAHLHFQVGHGGVTSSQSTNPLQYVHP